MSRIDTDCPTFRFPRGHMSDPALGEGETAVVNMYGKSINVEVVAVGNYYYTMRNLDYVAPSVTTRAYGPIARVLEL